LLAKLPFSVIAHNMTYMISNHN